MKCGCHFQNGQSCFNSHLRACVYVAEQMYFSSSLMANAAQTRMYRKLSKEGALRLIMAAGCQTTRVSV